MSILSVAVWFLLVLQISSSENTGKIYEAESVGEERSFRRHYNYLDEVPGTCNISKAKIESKWSPCSATCGKGIQYRLCDVNNSKHCDIRETKICFIQYCPSYLSFPRLHFFGDFTADVNTLNNIRCNYVNNRFSAASLEEDFPIPALKGDGYVVETRSWNPDGSGRFHLNAQVTSLCRSPGNCTTDDGIVGKEMKETTVVAMVDVDPDWQLASEIYGMKIKIQGILEAKFQTSAIQQPKPRGAYVMAAMKSKLVEISWISDEGKTLFGNANELSISMVMDEFVEKTRRGRVTGTIALTSEDDPVGTTAVRRMYPTSDWNMKGTVPIFLHKDAKILTLDLSSAFNNSENGRFHAKEVGDVDLVIDLDGKQSSDQECQRRNLFYVTQGGAISRQISDDNRWYEVYGGIMNIDISHLSNDIIELMTSHKISLVQKTAERFFRVILSETDHGISLGFMNEFIHRMNPEESIETAAFVSSFGKPLKGVDLQMGIVEDSFADTDCGWSICNRTLGVPRDSLHIRALAPSNEQGLVKFKIHARDPGNTRGCGLDGQIYPTDLRLRYNGTVFVEGGLLRKSEKAPKDYDYYLATLPSAIAVYTKVEENECPTWQDIKEIFIQYHNLYPVMWKHRIIDLSSYSDVKQRARMLKYAMFEVDFDDPKYMPITRDLSKSKRQLIKNWMDCGMKERDEPEYPSCEHGKLQARVTALRELLQRAVSLELSVIPPYYTAWLSLQTEYGRNIATAEILRSVFVDEMLHMTLAANILNAVNGTVDLTSFSSLPRYPTAVGFGDRYKLLPGVLMALGPLSRGLVNDVFMAVEGPGDAEQRVILSKITKLLEKLGRVRTSRTDNFVSSYPHSSQEFLQNSTEKKLSGSRHEPVSEAEIPKTGRIDWKEINTFTSQTIVDLAKTNVSSIGAFYTLIALDLAFVESCHQMGKDDEIPRTLFQGNLSHQLDVTHWHKREDYHLEDSDVEDLKLPIFAVKDLESALHAIVAIIFEGEGGTSCSPYVREGESPQDLPHYYRFMEIVHGRRLKEVHHPASWEMKSCLKLDHDCDANHFVTNETKLCFTGDVVPFYEDGVWPIVSNPIESLYETGSEVKRLNKEFNHLYTRLLKCLETTFGGNPDQVRQCMQEMHYMRLVGKKLATTPVFKHGVKIGHGTPTWVYQRDINEKSGLPTITALKELY